VNRPLLAISLRCTMYDAMWQLCTHAMATLASSAEASLVSIQISHLSCAFDRSITGASFVILSIWHNLVYGVLPTPAGNN